MGFNKHIKKTIFPTFLLNSSLVILKIPTEVKKEKTKGDKFDVYIHTSNLVITSLNSSDKWRMAKLEGKDPRKQVKETPAKENSKETKVEKEVEKKEDEK